MDASDMNSSYTVVSIDDATYSYTEQIDNWVTHNLSLYNLRNMMFIPSDNTIKTLPNIIVYTLDSQYSPISKMVISPKILTPNEFNTSSIFSYLRSKTESNEVTNISISITSKFPQKVKKMKISLP